MDVKSNSNGDEIKTISLYDHTAELKFFLTQKYVQHQDDATRPLFTELVDMAIDVSAFNIKKNSEIQSRVLSWIKDSKARELKKRHLFRKIYTISIFIGGTLITVLTTVLLTIYLE